MKLNNGKNIITDDDITMTGQQIGHSLSTVINKLEQDIEALKSNVKWIYKYGGVGSGGSGGGGGGGTVVDMWKYKVEIDDVVREDKSTVNLGELRIYKLTIKLYKVLNRTFSIKITYPTANGPKIIYKVISPDVKPMFDEFLNLQVNGDLTIAIEDDEGNFDLFTLSYIVTAYQFSLNYALNDEKHTLYKPNKNNIFVNDVKSKGLVADFHYIISSDIESAYYVYTDWNNFKSEKIKLDKGNGHIYIPLGKEISDENSGNYNFTVETHLTLANNVEEEEIPLLKLQDNLIPNNIYLKVETDGSIYTTNVGMDNPYAFYTGAIVFRVTPFLGYLDNTSNYVLEVTVNGLDKQVYQLLDLTTLLISIITDRLKWNYIEFKYSRKSEEGYKKYFFYTLSALGNFNWYPTQSLHEGETKTALPSISYQYIYSKKIYNYEKVYLIEGTNLNTLISRTVLDADKTFTNPIGEEYKSQDCLIAIGFLYNYLNDVTKPVCTFRGTNISNDIIVYQNAISIGNLKYKIYMPKDEEWHLLTIYRRAVTVIGPSAWFEFNFYIDGVLEKSSASFVSILELYSSIILHSGLYKINYMEISYFKHTPNTDISTNPFILYNLNPNKYYLDYLNDQGILFHYYSYKLSFYPKAIPENFKEAYTYASKFYNNYFTNRVEVTDLLVQGIANTINTPVLMLEYTENREAGDTNWHSDGENIFKWMEQGYQITNNPNILNEQYLVNVYWSKGKKGLHLVDTSKFKNTNFKLSLQGTSTLLYTNKNFDLAIDSLDEDNTYLYSPNFDELDNKTFLPETRFTLKADIVDSSHSNNNALGKFINTITTPFHDALQNTSTKYSPFIKNTLEGFPILLFFKNRYYKNSTIKLPNEDVYYLGIYNFNLGRDSEYNLGYKDLRLLPDVIDSGFNVIKIPNDKRINEDLTLNAKSYLDKLGVAEIRENRNYFDFSQDDPSILFPVSKQDNDYMFGKTKSNSLPVLESALSNMVKGVSKASGYIFDQLEKNMLESGGYEEGYKSKEPLNLVPNYKIHFKRSIKDSKSVLTNMGPNPPGEPSDLANALLGNGIPGEPEYVPPIIDYRAVSEYYVCCMALGLVDSVMKNLNVKTWNGVTFYPSFYDMDTALGKDNAGNDTLYMAFSDYWEPVDRKEGGKYFLEPAMSYKDWYKPDVLGYDIPMTYLLALAKYGYHTSENAELADWYPNNVWARFRRKNTTINLWTPAGGYVKEHVGCLENADKFINNFFKNHLATVPDAFFNLNYRKKYFVLSSGLNSLGYRNEDYSKFSGRRIYSVKDWLNGRFHILDLYFNLASISDSVKVYDLDTKEWKTKENVSYMNPDTKFIDATNSDITILQNIFTANNGVAPKYSTNIDIDITSEDYSPLSFDGSALKQRYIIKDAQRVYSLNLDTSGKSLNLGGSKNWTTISKIDTLIQQGGSDSTDAILYINSDKLTNLNGYSGNCGNWQLTMPALQDIILTSKGYTGLLSFLDSKKWPSLRSINIMGSKLGLQLNGVNVTKVNADEVESASNLEIINCPRLYNVSYKNARFNLINLTVNAETVYFSKYTYRRDSRKNWIPTPTDAQSPKCKYLSIVNSHYKKQEEGDPENISAIFINNQEYYVNNALEGLLKITLQGFREIYIEDCNYLEDIIIEYPETVEKLVVKDCSHNVANFKMNSQNLKEVDLSKFTNLKEVNFYGTRNFYLVILPPNVILKPGAFSFTNIKYLKGTNITLSRNCFSNSQYTLREEPDGDITNFNTSEIYKDDPLEEGGNLTSVFNRSSVDLEAFTEFNTKYADNLIKLITKADGMWGWCSKLKYDEHMLLEDYDNGVCRYDLSMYTNVTSAVGMLGGPYKTACHPDMFKNFGSMEGVNVENIFGWNDQSGNLIYVPINWLEYIKDRVTNVNAHSSSVLLLKYVVLKLNTTEQEVEFKINLFFPENINITKLENWNFDENHIIDYSGNPFSAYPKLNTIYRCFCGCKAKNVVDEVSGESFLYNRGSVTNISGSFGFSNYKEIKVNLAKYINWLYLGKNGLFQYIENWDESYHVGEFNKTINSISMFNSIYNKLITTTNLSSLAHVFRNCTVVKTDSDPHINISNAPGNPYITDIPYLFDNLKFIYYGNQIPIDWDWDMMNCLPRLKGLRRTFRYNWFNNKIPFNFFKTRKQIDPKTVYVEPSPTQYKEGTLYSNTYEQRIEDLRETFRYTKYSPEASTFTFSQSDFLNDNKKSYVECMEDDGTITEYYKYRMEPSIFSDLIEIKNTEFDDMQFEADYAATIPETLICLEPGATDIPPYDNYELSNSDYNKPFIAPDFFYSCKLNADLNGCFADSGLLGYVPDFLFKNCQQARISNFIKDVLIFPKVYKDSKERRYMNGADRLFISYYIGSNFISTLNLDDAFNFRIALPGDIRIVDEKTKDRSLHVLYFKDSFNRNLSSLKDANPKRIRPPRDKYIFKYLNDPNDILINLMYDTSTEVQQSDGSIKMGNLGFDLTYYNRLFADKLCNNVIMLFTYDKLFDSKTILNSIKKITTSDKNWIMEVGNGKLNSVTINDTLYPEFKAGQFSVGHNVKMPSATSSNTRAIYVHGIVYDRETGIAYNDPKSPVAKQLLIYQGFNENINIYYRNSKSIDNGYSLTFK